MDREQLIAEAVTELEPAYDQAVAGLGESPRALSLLVYYDEADPRRLVPLCFALPADKIQWCVEHDRLDALWDQQDPEERMGEAWAGAGTEILVSAIGELPERLDFEPAKL